jgi:hypothetical protein
MRARDDVRSPQRMTTIFKPVLPKKRDLASRRRRVTSDERRRSSIRRSIGFRLLGAFPPSVLSNLDPPSSSAPRRARARREQTTRARASEPFETPSSPPARLLLRHDGHDGGLLLLLDLGVLHLLAVAVAHAQLRGRARERGGEGGARSAAERDGAASGYARGGSRTREARWMRRGRARGSLARVHAPGLAFQGSGFWGVYPEAHDARRAPSWAASSCGAWSPWG